VRAGSSRTRYCPICGKEQDGAIRSGHLSSTPESALCEGRCAIAWRALTALRSRESEPPLVTLKNPQLARHKLSELLQARWRTGDWRVEPETVLQAIGEPELGIQPLNENARSF